jgi:hypothetical protein
VISSDLLSTKTLSLIAAAGCAWAVAEAAAMYLMFGNRAAVNGVVGSGILAAVLTALTAESVRDDLKGRRT